MVALVIVLWINPVIIVLWNIYSPALDHLY